MTRLANLPGKPCGGLTMTVRVPTSWSWRFKLGRVLLRAAAWVFGARCEVEMVTRNVRLLEESRRNALLVLDDLNCRDLPVLANIVHLVIPKIEDAVRDLRRAE